MFYEFKEKQLNPYFPDVTDVTPAEVSQNIDSLYLVDVREESEYVGDLGHIPQAILMVLSTIPENIKNLPKDKTVVFVCRSGGRSAQASAYALQLGYTQVYNLQGGMLFWNQLQLPTVT